MATAPSLRYFTPQEFLDTFDLVAYDDDNENGIKPQTIIGIGESVELHIDGITNRKWDNNAGSYYTATQEYHNAEGDPSQWPNDNPNISSQRIYFTKNTPINSLTTFQVNKNGPNQTADWQTLTEADDEITVKNAIGRIEITDVSDYPGAGKDQVRITYTYGEDAVPKDIKRLAILMTARSFSSQMLQKLNITTSEASGLSSAIQNFMNFDNEIKAIIDNRKFPEIRNV